MSEPTISRRCPTCHVSIREAAFFCPQCGNKIDRPAGNQTNTTSVHETEDVHDTEDVHQTEDVIPVEPQPADSSVSQASDSTAAGEAKKTAAPRSKGAVGSKIQQVTNKARNVEGDMLQRVQKIRNISNVVIDEASYDPSLRFVLVAAALFIVFLLIVLLNKFIE